MAGTDTQRYHLNDDCNQKFTDLICKLNERGSQYVLICIPKYPDEEILVVRNGERLGSDVDLEMILAVDLSGQTQIRRAQYPADINVPNVNRTVLSLDDAICSWERNTDREYTFILVLEEKIHQEWVIYASQSGKPTFPSDFEWGEILRSGLNLRAKNS